MTRFKRNATQTPPRRSGGAFALSLLVHVVVVLGFVRAILVPQVFDSIFRWEAPPPAVERLTYVEAPRGPGGPGLPGLGEAAPAPEPPRDEEEEEPEVVQPQPLQPPLTTPDGVPTPPAEPERRGAAGAAGSGAGTGQGGGGGGDPLGPLRPNYNDPRVWLRPTPTPGPPRSAVQRIDSMIVADFGPLQDSVAAEAGRRQPGDWTFERDGKKYGIDSRFIHLGKFSLPTAVLGLLPLNQQANPTQLQEGRRLTGVQQEIQEQALRRRNDTDFKDVVRSIRERKDRERAERRAAAAAAATSGASNPPGGE